MIRGTNAQFKFNLPYSYNDVPIVKITFWQRNDQGQNVAIVTKTKVDCSEGSNPDELLVTLMQGETLKFSDEKKAYVQLRGRSVDGFTFASKQEQITVYPVCDDSIIGDGDIVLPSPDDENILHLDGGSIA